MQSAAAFVRGLGDTKTPMLYNILFNLLNIVLNYLLIYPVGSVKLMGFTVKTIGLGLGVRGAALGTSGGALIAGLLMRGCCFPSGARFRSGCGTTIARIK